MQKDHCSDFVCLTDDVPCNNRSMLLRDVLDTDALETGCSF